jgi:gliding motility-associated lipoprotein GldH
MKNTVEAKKRFFMRFVLLFFVAWTGLSCTERRVYDEFQRVPLEGWEKTDSRLFSVDPMEEGGLYDMFIGLRTTASYPFMSLALMVETEIVRTQPEAVSHVKTDTLHCTLTDEQGRSKGPGVSIHQFDFPVRSVSLMAGDSLCVRVRHGMKGNILLGVRDVGVYLERRTN